MKEAEAKKKVKGLIGRVLLWFGGLVIILAISEWLHTAWVPTVNAEMAVEQLNGGDQSFMAMQSAEQTKNMLSLLTWVGAITWTLMLWVHYAVILIFSAKDVALKEDS